MTPEVNSYINCVRELVEGGYVRTNDGAWWHPRTKDDAVIETMGDRVHYWVRYINHKRG